MKYCGILVVAPSIQVHITLDMLLTLTQLMLKMPQAKIQKGQLKRRRTEFHDWIGHTLTGQSVSYAKKRATKRIQKKAFRLLIKELRPGIKERRAYDMSSLLVRYRELLGDEGVRGEVYTRQRLRDRLKKCFGEEVVFHQEMDRAKPQLIYSSSIRLQNEINAWALTHKAENKVNKSVSKLVHALG